MAATCSFSKLLGMASFLGLFVTVEYTKNIKKLGKSSWINLPWTNLNRSNMIQSHSQMIGVSDHISMGFHHQAGHPHRYIVTCQGWNDWTTCLWKSATCARFKKFNSSCICSSVADDDVYDTKQLTWLKGPCLSTWQWYHRWNCPRRGWFSRPKGDLWYQGGAT